MHRALTAIRRSPDETLQIAQRPFRSGCLFGHLPSLARAGPSALPRSTPPAVRPGIRQMISVFDAPLKCWPR
jgi:hypothetical protein